MTDGRGREDRQTQVAAQRRRRDDATLDAGRALKLAIPPEIQAKLTAEGKAARWINDVGSRVSDLTVRDDWDVVEGVEPRDVVIDKSKGTTAKAILVSKPQAFIAEDQAKRDQRRREQETALLKGHVPGADPAPNTYADKANSFGRGSQSLD